ncbi:MAG: DUF1573 domain-containing protein [Kiritimatiellia bacterium]
MALSVGAAEPTDAFRFGLATVGDQLTNRFMLPNGGPMPMAVVSATPSCECIRVLHWSTNVEAGATGAVEIVFVPDRAGEVDYRVFVQTSAPDQPEIEYAIQGEVAAAPQSRAARDWTLYLGTTEAEIARQDPGRAAWVDVRSADAYAQVRMPGSLQTPLHAVKTKGFLRGRPVVLVDDGHGSRALEEECRKLRQSGFSNLSIWYGGLNAWRRRGGPLEGAGALAVDRVPPAALHDIVDAADWLVVAVGDGMTNGPDGSVAIPFDVAQPEEFTAALEAALEARPQVASVLIATMNGEDLGSLAAAAGKANAFVFFLHGGWTAWAEHRQMMAAIQPGRSAVVRSASTSGGGATVRPGGCGGCPK